ncbi:hypothetical protein OF83DRAFT_46835 [Amylostereum chailletii]|nr:hypothetical protein OF83DRAFT_46835 [Amylostereum chailletii]
MGSSSWRRAVGVYTLVIRSYYIACIQTRHQTCIAVGRRHILCWEVHRTPHSTLFHRALWASGAVPLTSCDDLSLGRLFLPYPAIDFTNGSITVMIMVIRGFRLFLSTPFKLDRWVSALNTYVSGGHAAGYPAPISAREGSNSGANHARRSLTNSGARPVFWSSSCSIYVHGFGRRRKARIFPKARMRSVPQEQHDIPSEGGECGERGNRGAAVLQETFVSR